MGSLVAVFCRVYGVLLHAYPRPFRLEYGGEMQLLFRDRCRDVARSGSRATLVRFGLGSMGDWLRSTLREQAAHLGRGIASHAVRHARAVWQAGRNPVRRSHAAEWSITILIYLFATTTLVQAYVVPTGSMEGSIEIGDHILVDRLTYSDPGSLGRAVLPYRDVQRGDIVAFPYPEDPRQTYVKRILGLPGDRIRFENKRLIRNGRPLEEPYVRHTDDFLDPYRDNFPDAPVFSTTPRGRDMLEHHVVNGEVVVPPGMLFALGDNRDNSADSRYWGFVPRDTVVGEPLLVYWSYDAPTADLQEWTLHHVIDVALHFFTRTRWERTFLVLRRRQASEAAP